MQSNIMTEWSKYPANARDLKEPTQENLPTATLGKLLL